ncbi:MAG: hypothetical protein K0R57_6595 [Paenibacillaceae bacterium]|jgi:hypothetical protein|nr:hypothetical protein [Paenibacillaceae bacterium]
MFLYKMELGCINNVLFCEGEIDVAEIRDMHSLL